MISLTWVSAAPAVHEVSVFLVIHSQDTQATNTAEDLGHTSQQYSWGSWKPLSWGNLSHRYALQLRFINNTKMTVRTYCHWTVWWAGAQLRSKKDQTDSFHFNPWVHTLASQVSKAPVPGRGMTLGCPVPMLFAKHLPQSMPKVAAWDTWILLYPDKTFYMLQSIQS